MLGRWVCCLLAVVGFSAVAAQVITSVEVVDTDANTGQISAEVVVGMNKTELGDDGGMLSFWVTENNATTQLQSMWVNTTSSTYQLSWNTSSSTSQLVVRIQLANSSSYEYLATVWDSWYKAAWSQWTTDTNSSSTMASISDSDLTTVWFPSTSNTSVTFDLGAQCALMAVKMIVYDPRINGSSVEFTLNVKNNLDGPDIATTSKTFSPQSVGSYQVAPEFSNPAMGVRYIALVATSSVAGWGLAEIVPLVANCTSLDVVTGVAFTDSSDIGGQITGDLTFSSLASQGAIGYRIYLAAGTDVLDRLRELDSAVATMTYPWVSTETVSINETIVHATHFHILAYNSLGEGGYAVLKFTDDVNECATANGGCSGVCSNTYGSYSCSCGSASQFLRVNGKLCSERLQILSISPSMTMTDAEDTFLVSLFYEAGITGTSGFTVLVGSTDISSSCVYLQSNLKDIYAANGLAWFGVQSNSLGEDSNYANFRCVAPVVASAGKQEVSITTNSLTATFDAGLMFCTSTQAPQISEIIPSIGSVGGGENVTVIGESFGVDSNDLVSLTFGTVECTDVVFYNSTTASCTTPQVTEAASVRVTVTTRCGGISSQTQRFSFIDLPSQLVHIESITPSVGPISGGTAVKLKGYGFRDFGSLARCRFGTVETEAMIDVPFGGYFDPMNGTEITCVTPSMCTFSVDDCVAGCDSARTDCLAPCEDCDVTNNCTSCGHCIATFMSCLDLCDTDTDRLESECRANHAASVVVDYSLDGETFTASDVMFHFHSEIQPLNISRSSGPLAGSSVQISATANVSSSTGLTPRCKFGTQNIANELQPQASNTTHHVPSFSVTDAKLELFDSTLVFWCVVPPATSIGQVYVTLSLNDQNFSPANDSVVFSYQDNWFVANTTGTKPSAREMHTLTRLNSERAFVFGGYGLMNFDQQINATGFLNDLYELRINSQNRDTYPFVDPHAAPNSTEVPLYYPSAHSTDVEWVLHHTDFASGTPPIPRAGHTLSSVGNHLFVFGGLTDANVTYPLHHIDWIEGMEVQTVMLRRDVVSNVYKLPQEIETRVDHWRVVEETTKRLLKRETMTLLNSTNSFTNDKPTSLFDQAYFGSFGENVAPEQPPPNNGTYGNGGVHDFTYSRVGTKYYKQYTTTLNDLHIYHVDGNRWVSMDCVVGGDLPHQRLGHTATVVGENLYVFGGWTLETCPTHPDMGINQTLPCVRSYNDLFVLNVSAVSSLDFANACNSSAVASNATSSSNSTTSDWDIRSMPTYYAMPPRLLNWQHLDPTGDIPNERTGHTATFLSELNGIVVFGGQAEKSNVYPSDAQTLSSSDMADVYVLDIASNTWHNVTPNTVGFAPPARSWHDASEVDGNIVIFGGAHLSGYLNDAHMLTIGMSVCNSSCNASAHRVPMVDEGSSCMFESEDDGNTWSSPNCDVQATTFCCLSGTQELNWDCSANTDCVRAMWVKLYATGIHKPGVRAGVKTVQLNSELYTFGGQSGTVQANSLYVLNRNNAKLQVQPPQATLAQDPVWTVLFDWGSCTSNCNVLGRLEDVTLDSCRDTCTAAANCNFVNWDTQAPHLCELRYCSSVPPNSGGVTTQCHMLDRGSLHTTFPGTTDHGLSFTYNDTSMYTLWNPAGESACFANDTRWHCQQYAPRSAGSETERGEFSRYTAPHSLEKERFTFERANSDPLVATEELRKLRQGAYQQALFAATMETVVSDPAITDPLRSAYLVD